MKTLRVVALVAALVLFGITSHAARWGTAGCGVGALAFKDKPGKIQIIAATLNDIISPQTSAITSGTSGCYESRRDHASMYIKVNHVALQTDVARGQGETLDGLSKIYGCPNAASFSKTLKNNFNQIYGSSNDREIYMNIESAIENNNELANTCEIFS